MIPSPIVKVLSTIQKHGVKALLMGGQACVFYGAAEFSRDADIVRIEMDGNAIQFGRQSLRPGPVFVRSAVLLPSLARDGI